MIIAIMGESGAGKSTAMRNLPPEETYYFDCDKKGLPWKGWRSQYNAEKKNYYKTDDQNEVLQILHGINTMRPNVHYVVVDTLNGIMVADEMRRTREKGYDKWIDLAASTYALVDYALTVRDDLTVIFLAHTQTDRDDSGYQFTRIKTSGKKLDKIVVESKFPVVVLAKCTDGQPKFEIRANHSTAKVPMGAFDEGVSEIDNDVMILVEALKDF